MVCIMGFFQAFNNVGSWMVSFGIGALTLTLTLLGALTAVQGRAPDLHWDVLKVAGVQGGLCWVVNHK